MNENSNSGSHRGNVGSADFPTGNFSLGVALGTHIETESEVFQFNEDRYRHMLVIGRTGAGKSNHIHQMERQDIRSGAGCFILAAHESDALYPLSCVPDEHLEDVVFIDASNPDYLPNMNPLDIDVNDRMAVSKAIDDVLELLTLDCEYGWAGPRFESYLRHGLGLLLMDPAAGHCIADLNELYTSPEYVKELLKYCTDKAIFNHWTKVFPHAMKSNEQGDVIAWFLSKVARFSSDSTLRHMFGPGKSTIDIQSVVDEGKVLIAFVPESRIGSSAARTISKWLVMQLRDAIMKRRSDATGWQGIDYGLYEDGRDSDARSSFDPFFVYVDEFAKFASTDFEVLLAEARKQHVGFVLSSQTLSQVQVYDRQAGHATDKLRDAILGNVGSIVCYSLGVRDAELLADQFDIDADKLKRIERYRPIARLCSDNRMNRPGTLEVGLKPEPDNPSAARRVAKGQVLSGAWTEVEGAPSKGAFLRMLARGDEAEAESLREIEHSRKPRNGLGHAYRYRNRGTGAYGLALRYAEAAAFSLGNPQAVWVVFRNGEVDHVASADEYQEELEVRVGERISEGLSTEKLREFDDIENQDESVRWLEANRPDYHDIVARTVAEMEEAAVLSADEAKELAGGLAKRRGRR